MTQMRISDAALLLGVSDDTVRRMVDAGRLPSHHDDAGRAISCATAATSAPSTTSRPAPVGVVADESARNRMRGIVTRVLTDTVMAQVELQCGPFRVVSLMSREAAEELGLEVGTVAVASIKSTNVVVGVPQ